MDFELSKFAFSPKERFYSHVTLSVIHFEFDASRAFNSDNTSSNISNFVTSFLLGKNHTDRKQQKRNKRGVRKPFLDN